MRHFTKQDIDSVLTHIKRISQAPRSDQITSVEAEKDNRYKAVDASGKVYLIQNPAVWDTHTDSEGRTFRVRPEPVLATAQKPEKQQDDSGELF